MNAARRFRQRGWPWAALAIAAVLATLPFWLSDLDLRAAAAFHRAAPFSAGYDASWPQGNAPFFHALYVGASALSWGIVVLTLAVFIAPRWRRDARLRDTALTLLGTLALGTGLLVNAIGKDYTGRPRPRTLVEFGGQAHYLRPLELGTPGVGKSFPCGHCSAGFAVGAVGLGLLAARPALGVVVIAGSLLLGGAVGAARMAAGAHFLSDVLWSGVLTWLAALLSHALVCSQALRTRWAGWPPWLKYGPLALLLGVVIAGLLLVRPFHRRIDVSMPLTLAASPLPQYRLVLQDAALVIVSDAALPSAWTLKGEVRGVGWPNVRITEQGEVQGSTFVHTIERTGRVRETFAPMELRIRPDIAKQLEIQIARGSVRWQGPIPATPPRIHIAQPDAAE